MEPMETPLDPPLLTFSEQFSIAIHDHVDITQLQKVAYLSQALKHGSARNMVEGL